MLPVVLYFLNMPNEGFSAQGVMRNLRGTEVEGGEFNIQGTAAAAMPLEFKELELAAYNPVQRRGYEGRMVRIKGQFAPDPRGNDKMFSLVRFKMTCCAADAVPLNVVIMLNPESKETVSDIKALQWVDVAGQVQFRKRKDREEYVSVLLVPSRDQIRPAAADPSPYLQ
jgi:hypothetical protein